MADCQHPDIVPRALVKNISGDGVEEVVLTARLPLSCPLGLVTGAVFALRLVLYFSEVVGVFVGGLAATLMAGRFRPQIERGGGIGRSKRLGYAFAGGVLTGFGARLARGCTSGLGLSGGGTLAVAGFVFLIGFFVAGFGVSYLMRRAWQ